MVIYRLSVSLCKISLLNGRYSRVENLGGGAKGIYIHVLPGVEATPGVNLWFMVLIAIA